MAVMVHEVGSHQRVIVVGWVRSPAVQASQRAFLGPCVYADVDEAGVRRRGAAGRTSGLYAPQPGSVGLAWADARTPAWR